MGSFSVCCGPASVWLFIWMINNIGVTLLNKAAFAKVDFPYPWFLTVIHMICNYLGCQLLLLSIPKSSSEKQSTSSCMNSMTGGPIDRKVLDWKGYMTMMAFSIIFSLNIAIGNVSLKYVSVNFNQVMRSSVPAVTICLGLLMGKTFRLNRKLAVIPIILGVAMACFGDMDYTVIGFLVTLFCVILAALKVVVAGEILTGDLKLHPVDLLCHMAPLAMIQCLFISFITGEVTSIYSRWNFDLNPTVVGYAPMLIVWMSGFASFTLNICSLQANKLTSPLTLCIASNVKQVIMIMLSTVIFETVITPLNGGGIAVVLCGSALYSYVSIIEKPADNNKNTEKVVKKETKKLMSSNSLDETVESEYDDDEMEFEYNNKEYGNLNTEDDDEDDNNLEMQHTDLSPKNQKKSSFIV